MKIFQSDLEEIQELTGKEYDVQYSNNAESEYVAIYNMAEIERMLLDMKDIAKTRKSSSEFWEKKFKESREIKVYINKMDVNQWIGKFFEDKDYISFDDLIGCIEDLDGEVEHLKKKIDDLENQEEWEDVE